MASIRGIKNEKGVSKPEIQSQDEHEVVTDKPQSSRDAEIASLKREISALTEALEKQQWLNPVELDRVDPFGRSRAPNRDPYQFTDVDREPNRGFERSVLGQDRHHHREPLGFHREHHCGRVTNPWCARELQDQRLLNPNTFPLGYDWVKPPVETHDRPCFGPPKSSGVGQPRTHHAFKPFGHFDPGPDPSLDPHNHDTLYTDRELRHHHEPVLDLDGFDRAAPNQDHNNYNWNREPLVLDRAPRDLDHAPRDLDRAPPGFDRAPPAFNRAPGFEQAPPCVDLAQLGFDRAPPGFDLAPPPFDQEFPQTRVGHDRFAPPPFDREHHQRDQMEGDYGGGWGFHHPHGVDRGFDREPRHLQGLDHGVDREPRRGHGFNRAPPPQQAHVFFACHGVDSPVLNREHCTTDPRWDTSQCWDYVDEIEEIIIQPPESDIELAQERASLYITTKEGHNQIETHGQDEDYWFSKCWSRQQLITEYCIQGHVSIDKALVLLQEINAEYKARVDQYGHGDVSIA
uniref:Uncharacterized protein n=1 Tax=Fagus sylvatica TaxID=28930 RepID=A0A2N9G0J4_FAGSY